MWDGRLGRWLTTDPKHQYASPYLGMGNNPLSLVDPDGGSTESTGVRKNSDGSYTVVGARNDGDCGIYLVDSNNNWDIKTSQSIGYNTLNPFDFMVPDDITGGYKKDPAEVTFSIKNLADGNAIFEKYTSEWESIATSAVIPTALVSMPLLAYMSKNDAYFDIKSDYPQSTGGIYTPVLLDGNTITTVRALGNRIFGANMRTVYEKSYDTFLDTPKSFYKLNMPFAGKYNQYRNNGNGYNSGYPYYGEHTYSGTNIYNGYFRK